MGRRSSEGEGVLIVVGVVVIVGLIAKAMEFISEHAITFSIGGGLLATIWIYAKYSKYAKEKEAHKILQEHLIAQRAKELEKENEREAERGKKNEAKLEKEKEKAFAKKQKEDEKILKSKINDAKKTFSLFTIEHFKLGNVIDNKVSLVKPISNLENERIIVSKYNPEFFNKYRKLTATDLDRHILNGRLNSVIGIEGLTLFKVKLLSHLDEQIQNAQNILMINIAFLKDLMYQAGIYYEYETAPDHIKKLENEYEWRSFHKLLLEKKLSESVNSVDIDTCNNEYPKHFKGYSNEDLRSLTIAIDSATNELHQELTEYINNNHKYCFEAA